MLIISIHTKVFIKQNLHHGSKRKSIGHNERGRHSSQCRQDCRTQPFGEANNLQAKRMYHKQNALILQTLLCKTKSNKSFFEKSCSIVVFNSKLFSCFAVRTRFYMEYGQTISHNRDGDNDNDYHSGDQRHGCWYYFSRLNMLLGYGAMFYTAIHVVY